MEYLDVVDETGCPTGQTVERSVAHAQGIRPRTAHVWLVRRRAGRLQVLLQRRSENKDSNPGKSDISSAGHIPAGVEWKPSALRELREELGVNTREEQLHYCGQRRFFHQAVFHGKPFLDRQAGLRDLPAGCEGRSDPQLHCAGGAGAGAAGGRCDLKKADAK